MRNDLADVTLVMDKSGSMQSCVYEAQTGLKKFIEDQQKQSGECNFSCIEFDNIPRWLVKTQPIKNVTIPQIMPAGMTALLDAVGMAIDDTGKRLSNMKEEDRPGLVVIAIITDGQENNSNTYTREQIRDMIEHQKSVYNWQFVFLGANQDSFTVAQQMSIDAYADYTSGKIDKAYVAVSNNVTRMRGASSCGQQVCNTFTPDELIGMQ